MEHSEQLDALAKALVAVQTVMRPAIKDSQNPHFKSKYADLESVMEAIREPLAAHGLVVTQTLEPAPDGVVVVTTLLHESGQWLRGKCLLKPQRNDPQGIGSCITYGRRYGAAAIVGLHQSDDDGEAASGRGDDKPRLEGPKRLERPPAQPSAPPPLTLTGGSFEDEYGRLVNQGEIKSLMVLIDKHGISTDALKTFCQERWGVSSRKELRVGMLPVLSEWAAASGKAVA